MKRNFEGKIAIYSRKSKFTGKGESIENQIEMCKMQLKLDYPDITEEDILIFEDEGFSGGNINRPQFQEMLKLCEEKKICCVICYKFDRISRNSCDFVTLIKSFEDWNIKLISVKERFDNSTLGRAMVKISSIFAELERDVTAERIRDNLYELAKTGRWLGGTTPTGFRSVPFVCSYTADGKERTARKLEVIPEQAQIIKLLFDKYLELDSITKLETYCLQNNIVSKQNKYYTRCTLSIILRNPVYMIADETAWEYFTELGALVCYDKSSYTGEYGISCYSKTDEKKKSHHAVKDYDEWIVSIGKHPGLIPSKQWVEVQKHLNANKAKSYKRSRSNVALLSGRTYCACCGSFMRPKLTQRVNKNGEFIYDYLCELKEHSRRQKCDMKRANGNELDKMVLQEINQLAKTDSHFIQNLKQALKTTGSVNRDNEIQLKQLQKTVNDYQNKIDKLVMTLTLSEGTDAQKEIIRKINEYSETINKTKAEISKIDQITKSNCSDSEDMERLSSMLCSFSAMFNTMSLETKRRELKKFIHKIVWDGETVHIYFFGSEDAKIDLSGISNSEPLTLGCKSYTAEKYTLPPC